MIRRKGHGFGAVALLVTALCACNGALRAHDGGIDSRDGSGQAGVGGAGGAGEAAGAGAGAGTGGPAGSVGTGGCMMLSDTLTRSCKDGVVTTTVFCPPSQTTTTCRYGCKYPESFGFGFVGDLCNTEPQPDAGCDGMCVDANSDRER